MPLVLTPAAAFATTADVPVASVYAVIMTVSYDTRQKLITFRVAYYYSEEAYDNNREALQINALPTGFSQPATPQQANAVPIFQFLEQALAQQLGELLGQDTKVENVA